MRVGSVTVHRCHNVVAAWCGVRREPVDPGHAAAGTLGVSFVWYPATGRAVGTVVAVEGGPGFPSTGSAPEYRALYRPLLRTRNLLLVDNRGTGGTARIRCRALQGFAGDTTTPAFNSMVGTCGRHLGASSDLYGTAYAAGDLAGVIRALRTGRVDLYGDSYGSWFAQSFASRYPSLLRSVVLDSAYSLTKLSPWYASTATTARDAFRRVCTRDLACSRQAGGDPWRRVARVVARVRTAPIAGWTRNPEGARVHASVTVRTMVDLTSDAGFDPLIYRDLDAADRAALGGAPQPLLRLAAEARQDDNATPESAADYSDGQYFAVACVDYPQLFDMRASFAARETQLQASIAAAPAASLEPFTPHEWLTMNAYSEAFTACLKWPRIGHPKPPAGRKPPLIPARIPVLVIGGDLDSWTPVSDLPAVLHQIGPSARLVVLRNAVHTATEGDILLTGATRCGRHVVREFVTAPTALSSRDAACASRVPPIHTPGAFPRRLAGAVRAHVVVGRPSDWVRRAATVATEAMADATQTWWSDEGARGRGLYGGRFRGIENGSNVRMILTGARFVSNAAVTGAGLWNFSSGRASASLTVSQAGRRRRFVISYSQINPLATVRSGASVMTLPAP
jgi:pimeloyl-ACP methyl ester carboxylesterase